MYMGQKYELVSLLSHHTHNIMWGRPWYGAIVVCVQYHMHVSVTFNLMVVKLLV